MTVKTLSLHEAIYSNRDPREVVAFDKDTTYHLYDLQLMVKALSVFLSMSKEKRFAIYVENSYLFTVAFAACLYAKKIPVFAGIIRKDMCSKDNGCFDAIISDKNFDDVEIPFFDITTIKAAVRQTPLKEIPLRNHDAEITPVLDSNLKIEFYTSGSTGKSKKIDKTLRHLENDILHLENLTKVLDNSDNSAVVASVAPYHMYGLTFRILLPLLRKIPFDAQFIKFHEELCGNYKDKKLIFVSSPAFLKRIDPFLKAPKIIFTLSAGSSMDIAASAKYYAWSECEITEIYGSTETNFMGYRKLSGAEEYYTPFAEVSFKENNGDLYLYSPLIDKKYKLDDKLEFNGDKFKVIGRKDKVIKLEENRVSLTQIEDLVKKHEHITDCVALPLEKGDRTFIGIVVAVDDEMYQDLTSNDNKDKIKQDFVKSIKSSLKDHLLLVAMPRYVRILKEIPLNSMGKKITSQLRELFND